jgi:succinylarginine dihydrolase
VTALEANFDGLVGPTHNHAGLSVGNVASQAHGGERSNPREAALQGLDKAGALRDLGLPQGVLPPQERPHLAFLRDLGFRGVDADVIAKAAAEAPTLLAVASSASAMWTANAATVTPSVDAADGRLHLTPANLASKLHRSLEPPATAAALAGTFPEAVVHPPLPAALGDEGAANHTRLGDPDRPGLHLFVYGRRALSGAPPETRFPARQTREASEAVARRHGVRRALFAAQSPRAIDAGVFHHDVIGVGHERTLLVHEAAFRDRAGTLARLREAAPDLEVLEVREAAVSLEDAVRSYLFNSQLVRPPGDARPTLVAPRECAEIAPVRRWLESAPFEAVRFFDLRQSMHNGGGPACLRLRVLLTAPERAAVRPGAWLTAARQADLEAWVRRHYRDRLDPADLADPRLLRETREALDALTGILGLGGAFYPFQRARA